jgi:phage/plasmid-associated DNA primase
MLMIPFRQQLLDESEHDKRLIDGSYWRASGELPGVLIWAAAGLASLRARGYFLQPAACQLAKATYRQAANPAATFLTEMCEVREGFETSAPDLYSRYRGWIHENGYEPLGHQQFADEVRRAFRGVESSKNPRTLNGRRVRVWEGLSLR